MSLSEDYLNDLDRWSYLNPEYEVGMTVIVYGDEHHERPLFYERIAERHWDKWESLYKYVLTSGTWILGSRMERVVFGNNHQRKLAWVWK